MITRRAALVGAAAVAAAAIAPTAAEGMTTAGLSNPLPPCWIHCDWRVEITEREFPELYRVLFSAMFPWDWAPPERIPLPRFTYYAPWHSWSDMLIIKARYGDDGLDTFFPVGQIVGWRTRGP